MAFPTFPSPELNDPWTEGGIDYYYDGIRWVPSATGSALTQQQLRLFNGLVAWANTQGKLAAPTIAAWNPRSAVTPGASVNYLISWGGDAPDNLTITVDWKDGTPVQIIEARVNGEWAFELDPDTVQGGYIDLPHTLPAEFPLGSWKPSLLLSNEWGDTGPAEGDFIVTKEIGDYTFTYSSLLPGLDAPTKASMSDNNQTTTVFATKSWADGGEPWVQIDFGEVVVPDWITIRRANAIPGTAYHDQSPEYWMRQRTLHYGMDDGQGGITWVEDGNFEANTSWAIRNVDIKSWQYSEPCRYIRFGMASNFSLANHGPFGISFGDISFGHADRTGEVGPV